MMRRYLAKRPREVQRIFGTMRAVGCWGSEWRTCQTTFGFCCRASVELESDAVWFGLFSMSGMLFWCASRAAAVLCSRKCLSGGPSLNMEGSLRILTCNHVREKDKALLRTIWVVSGMPFLLVRVQVG